MSTILAIACWKTVDFHGPLLEEGTDWWRGMSYPGPHCSGWWHIDLRTLLNVTELMLVASSQPGAPSDDLGYMRKRFSLHLATIAFPVEINKSRRWVFLLFLNVNFHPDHPPHLAYDLTSTKCGNLSNYKIHVLCETNDIFIQNAFLHTNFI